MALQARLDTAFVKIRYEREPTLDAAEEANRRRSLSLFRKLCCAMIMPWRIDADRGNEGSNDHRAVELVVLVNIASARNPAPY